MKAQKVPEEIMSVMNTLLQPYHLSLEELLNEHRKENRTSKRFISVKEASEIYSVSRHTLFRWNKAGKIKAVKCSPGKSGKVLLDVGSLESFMLKHSA